MEKSKLMTNLQNIKLHNKLKKTQSEKEEILQNSKELFRKYKEYSKELQEEINQLKFENDLLKNKYNAIPKFIRNIFK